MSTAIESAGQTDVGRTREHNEDHFHSDLRLGLHVVCDGMGGHSAGEVASRLAADTLAERLGADPRLRGASPEAWEAALREAMQAANAAVHALGRESADRKGMGTTCSAVVVRGTRAVLAHVGDSRAYLIRSGQVHQLSDDHTFVAEALRQGIITAEQAAGSPHGNVLTRAIGPQASVLVDTLRFDVLPGDTLLLCSDGLHNYFDGAAHELASFLAGDDLADACARLIDAANERGGEDNITALALRMTAAPPGEKSRVTEKTADFAALQRMHLFSELDLVELSQLTSFLESLAFTPGQAIVEQSDVSESLFVIVEGEVDVERDGVHVATLEAGAHFGEMALLNQRPRSATVRARGTCRLLRLPRQAFHAVVQQNHVVGVKVLWRLAQTLSVRLDEAYETPRQREIARTTLNFGLYPSPFESR